MYFRSLDEYMGVVAVSPIGHLVALMVSDNRIVVKVLKWFPQKKTNQKKKKVYSYALQ